MQTPLHRYIPIAARFLFIVIVLEAVGLAPTSDPVMVWLSQGQQAASDGHYREAAAAYRRILDRLGSQPVIYERLVQIGLDAGQPETARLYLEALADLDGWTLARQDQLRIVLEQIGDTTQASALRRFILAQDADDGNALYAVAREQIQQGQWAQAGITLEHLLALEPDHAEAAYLLGALLAPHDPARAADYLAQAAADPAWAAPAETVRAALEVYATLSRTDAHTRLGLALAESSEWSLAEQAFQMALDTNAVNPTALAYRGFVRDQQSRDGLPDLQAALAMSPNDPTIYYLLGYHWRQAEDYVASYDAFSQAYWLAPDNPALAAEVAQALELLGNRAEAEAWFRVALDLSPLDPQWYRLLAAFYADTGFELETRGLVFIQEASELVPNDPDIQASLGWAYYQTGDITRAYKTLNRALNLDPDHVRSRYYFGVVLEAKGDRGGAVDSFSFVLDRAGPDSKFGRLAARALRRLGYAP